MRIAYLTSGTGSYYCGSCMRDNTLAAAMNAAGHDVILLPLYMPLTLDEPNMAEDSPIFFGGINVYLQQISSLFRHTPRLVDWLFDRRGLLRIAGRQAGSSDLSEMGEMTVSMLRGDHGHQCKEVKRIVRWLKDQPPFDAVCFSNALLLGAAPAIRQALDVPIVCVLQGEDTFLNGLHAPWSEHAWQELRERGKDVTRFVAVSKYYRGVMQSRLELPDDKICTIWNGIDLKGFEKKSDNEPNPPTVGYLARLNEAKGLGCLIDAFILMRQQTWPSGLRLIACGTMVGPDRAYVAEQKEKLRQAGIADTDYEFIHDVNREEKQKLLRRMTVFSVPATYGESFGLYVLEAQASGLPVVQPDHAAFPEILNETGGGVLVTPNESTVLGWALSDLLHDPALCRTLGDNGRCVVQQRFCASRMAQDMTALFEELAADKKG